MSNTARFDILALIRYSHHDAGYEAIYVCISQINELQSKESAYLMKSLYEIYELKEYLYMYEH